MNIPGRAAAAGKPVRAGLAGVRNSRRRGQDGGVGSWQWRERRSSMLSLRAGKQARNRRVNAGVFAELDAAGGQLKMQRICPLPTNAV
jgi:hypothetical protein